MAAQRPSTFACLPRSVRNAHSRCPKAKSRLFLRHIRKFDVLASVRERDPRISHACKIFTLLRVVCFFCKRRALGGRFPRGLAFGSHLISPRVAPSPSAQPCYDHDLESETHFLLLEL